MRILSIIQPDEMSEDFYFDKDAGKWRINFPEGGTGGGGSGHTLPEGMQYVLSPSGKVEEETVLYKTFTPRNLLAVSGTTEPFEPPKGKIVWDGVTKFSLPFPEDEEEQPVDCALLLTHISDNQGFIFDIDAGVSCRIQIGFYHQDLLETTPEMEELRYFYDSATAYSIENAQTAERLSIHYENGSITKTYRDEEGYTQTEPLVTSEELSYTLSYISQIANISLRPTVLLKVYSQEAGVEVTLDATEFYEAEGTPIQIPEVVTAGELKKYKAEVEKQITNIINASENGYFSTAYGVGARAGDMAVAIGARTTAGEYAYAMGANAISEQYGTSVGTQVQSGSFGTAVGYMAKAALYGTSYGYLTKSEGSAATALGMCAEGISDFTLAMGAYAKAHEQFATSIGANTTNESVGGTCIGASSRVPSGCDYSIAIGYGAYTTSAQQARIGDIDITLLASNVQSLSDERDKTNILDADLGLDFINKLRPVVYQFDYREKYFNMLYKLPNREDFEKSEDFDTAMVEYEHQRKDFYVNPVKDGSLVGKRPHYGLIAQEFKKTIDELGVDHAAYQHHEINGGCDVHSIGYADLVPNLIKAIQELSQENKTLMERLEKLESK